MLKTRISDDLTDVVLGAYPSRGKVISSDRHVGAGFRRDVVTLDGFPTVPVRGSETVIAMPAAMGGVRGGSMLLMVDELQKRVAYRQLGRYDREGRRLTPEIGLISTSGEIE